MFKPDGPIFSTLSRLLDLMILNVLWMVCCLPVITIGPATTAMYTVLFKMREKKDDSIIGQFFRALRSSFRQAFPAGLLLVGAGAVLLLDFRVVFYDSSFSMQWLRWLFWVVLAVAAAYFSWLFPLIAKFENGFRGMLRNARLMMIRHLPVTVIITFLNLLPALLAYFDPYLTLWNMLLFWLFLGFSLIAFVNSLLLYRVFYRYFSPEYIAKLKKATEELG